MKLLVSFKGKIKLVFKKLNFCFWYLWRRMNRDSIFKSDIKQNLNSWLLLGFWAFFRSLSELSFLGVLRDYSATWLQKESYLGLNLIQALLSLAFTLILRFVFQSQYLSQSIKMKKEFEEIELKEKNA